MKICFRVQSNHGDAIRDPDYCENHPLGGTETAVIKLTQALQQLGVEAVIATKPSQIPSNADVSVAVRCWQLLNENAGEGHLNYLWCHDDIDQPVVEKFLDPGFAAQTYQKCDGVIMVSHYQAKRWISGLGAPIEKIFITSNGIDHARFKIDLNTLSGRLPHAYFASTPFRGLSQLLDLWPIVYQVLGPRTKLTICSSLQVYGSDEIPEYEELYARARSLPGIEYLGSVSQKRLRQVAASCRALAYPCMFPETGCIAAMEAMASGSVVVSTSLGALPETAWRNPLVPLSNGWEDCWIEELLRVLVDDHHYMMLAEQNLQIAKLMDWKSIAQKWIMRFQSDLVKKRHTKQG